MEKIIKIVLDGKPYLSAPETLHSGCVGCVLLKPNNTYSCSRYGEKHGDFTFGDGCVVNKCIFVDDTGEYYTVEQVFAAIVMTGVYSSITTDTAIFKVKEYLVRNSDPEYADFLRLKNKFEQT